MSALKPLSIETNGKLMFQVNGGSGTVNVGAAVPIGQLIHVAATLDDVTGAMKHGLRQFGLIPSVAQSASRQ